MKSPRFAATSRPSAATRPSPSPTTGERIRRGATSRSTRLWPIRSAERFSIISAAFQISKNAASASSAIRSNGSPKIISGFLRFFRFHARFGRGEPDEAALDACTARANDLMALSRERIADELLKLLAVDEPSPTVQPMLDRAILKPVLPEIEAGAVESLRSLVSAEREAGIEADPLRRFAALLPRDPKVAETIAARLKLSNRARKRLACAAEPDDGTTPKAIAYRAGVGCAVDRLLLDGRPAEAKEIAGWSPPRLPISGGALIKRGAAEGPAVSRTLRQIEDKWVEAGFPGGSEFEAIVSEALESSR
jgi:poly(A) polymerase